MQKNFLVGIAAGIVSFIAMMSATTGTPILQFVMFLVAPLPLFLAGLALGWRAAAIGAITAGIAITLLAGPLVGFVSAGSQFGPPVLLTYLALLNREVASPGGNATATEWYPIGRLVLWCAVLGTLLSVILLMMLGKDAVEVQENLSQILRQAFEQFRAQSGDKKPLSEEDLETMTRVALSLLPAASGMLMTGILLINLYIAARVTDASGTLSRPWPDLAALAYPPVTPLVLAASVVVSAVLSGFAGMTAAAASGAFYFAYVLLGLAIVHHITRGNPGRFAILWAVYFALFFLNTIASLVVAIIGLTEPFSPLRRNFMRPPPHRGPPGPD
ncbi:MAG: YybS family protein [Alphaproteobacteria bacterium]|nr:YybS family protein [Alphaproteobacteria bacterium]